MSVAKKLTSSEAELTRDMYNKFVEMIYQLSGVNLPFNPKNEALLKNRIIRLLRKYDFASYEDYWTFLKNGDESQRQEFISALTTNMTSFFREIAHFDWLKKQVKEHFAKSYSLRIWCAAASTGQEPYTIAICICESLTEAQRPHVKILASDIDLEVLKKASIGYYYESEITGLSKDLVLKYFDRVQKDGETLFRVKDFLRDMVSFSQFNLISEKYEFKRPFDIIFCRNVLIYFDEKTVKSVIDKLTNSLAPKGHLLLGHSESGNVKHDKLKALSKAIYQRKDSNG